MYKRLRPKQEPGLSQTCSFPRMSCHHFSSPCLWIFGLLKKEQTKSNTAIFIETIWRCFFSFFLSQRNQNQDAGFQQPTVSSQLRVNQVPQKEHSVPWMPTSPHSSPRQRCVFYLFAHLTTHGVFLWTSVLTVIQPKTHSINKAITQLKFALLPWPTILILSFKIMFFTFIKICLLRESGRHLHIKWNKTQSIKVFPKQICQFFFVPWKLMWAGKRYSLIGCLRSCHLWPSDEGNRRHQYKIEGNQ